ncbi:MAG TPA: DUF4364 family protein [Clostridia bacterium]|jgi:predicted transcriptional regulator|nr:DUF4364 family protein [Clostridia bacterium]
MIHRDTEELAENKLLLLYILSEAKIPLSKNQVTQVVLENNLMNYFSMQQFLSELVQKGLVVCYEDIGRHFYRIHRRGNEVLGLFLSRIPDTLKKDLKQYLTDKGMLLKRENSVQSSYLEESSGTYSVYLKLTREDGASFEMKVPIPSEKNAKKICVNWNEKAPDLCREIVRLLQGQDIH